MNFSKCSLCFLWSPNMPLLYTKTLSINILFEKGSRNGTQTDNSISSSSFGEIPKICLVVNSKISNILIYFAAEIKTSYYEIFRRRYPIAISCFCRQLSFWNMKPLVEVPPPYLTVWQSFSNVGQNADKYLLISMLDIELK